MEISTSCPAKRPVAIIDDDAAVLDSLQVLLLTEGVDVETFGSGEAFLNSGVEDTYDCILLDIHLPGLDGFQVAARLRQHGFKGSVILMTGRPDGRIRRQAKDQGVQVLLEKPVRVDALIAAVEQGLSDGCSAQTT